MSDDMPDESMDVSSLDGFLTAILIGPNTLMPSRWLPFVHGETADQPMVWQSPAQAERILSLFMRHMNDVAWILENAPDGFEPLCP